MDLNPQVLNWNVRGLNDRAKRNAVREFVESVKVNLVCLQETKLNVIDRYLVMQCLGSSFDEFAYLPAIETRGGILLAWDSTVLSITNIVLDSFSLTGHVKTLDQNNWWITVVYGPQDDADKIQFLQELTERRSLCSGPWILLGDFNLILRASEKNNENINRPMMNRFRHFVGNLELKELYMHGRLFTWSSERENPTLSRIDRALVSVDWDLNNPDSFLQALSSNVSDHAPLHLSLNGACRPKRRFRFELFWTRLEGFEDAVKEAWQCEDSIVDPFKRLDALFRNTAKALQAWGQRRVGNVKIQMAIANLVILRLDAAHDRRQLSEGEAWLRKTLKVSLLGLASLERTIARQRSRMRWLQEGDANTRLFHAVANGRRTKNFIAAVTVGDEIVTEQDRKLAVFIEAYQGLLGTLQNRNHSLNFDFLQLPATDLSGLEMIFTEEEV
jgi:mannosylglycoprotein endo-beta-mannosidase